jgi:hypothetical protein
MHALEAFGVFMTVALHFRIDDHDKGYEAFIFFNCCKVVCPKILTAAARSNIPPFFGLTEM